MTLREFLKKNREITQTNLARVCGVSQGMISHVVTGRKRPSGPLAIRIVEATGGAVSFKDLYILEAEEEAA